MPMRCRQVEMTGYFSDNTDPTSYYYCDRSGTGTKLTCPDKYEWNQYELSCVKASFNKVTNFCQTLLQDVTGGVWDSVCSQYNPKPAGTICTLTCNAGFRVVNKALPLLEQEKASDNTAKVECRRRAGAPSKWTLDAAQLKCVSGCDPNPCGFGTCSINNGIVTCTCKQGWTQDVVEAGQPCLKEVNNCNGFDCGANGYCINGSPNAKCECLNDYTGNKCETAPAPKDPCANIVCESGKCRIITKKVGDVYTVSTECS